MARRYFISVQVRQQVQLHAVLQHFSFCTKPFFSCYRLLLTKAKIQISRWSNSLSHSELKSTPLGQDGGYLVRQNHSGHRVCAGMFIFYHVICGCVKTLKDVRGVYILSIENYLCSEEKKNNNLLALWHAWQSDKSMAFVLFRGQSLSKPHSLFYRAAF